MNTPGRNPRALLGVGPPEEEGQARVGKKAGPEAVRTLSYCGVRSSAPHSPSWSPRSARAREAGGEAERKGLKEMRQRLRLPPRWSSWGAESRAAPLPSQPAFCQLQNTFRRSQGRKWGPHCP
ncbi:hypothetical protein MC885_001239 [Smutsia gigantea]|nr:hypothetical protein MC885_001239 [Smutsia gigantea]